MVPRAGFEPATLGLEVLCSIQLSYRGVVYIIASPLGFAAWTWYNVPSRGRRIMANIRAFQACDESSILSARTKSVY